MRQRVRRGREAVYCKRPHSLRQSASVEILAATLETEIQANRKQSGQHEQKHTKSAACLQAHTKKCKNKYMKSSKAGQTTRQKCACDTSRRTQICGTLGGLSCLTPCTVLHFLNVCLQARSNFLYVSSRVGLTLCDWLDFPFPV